MKKNRRSKIVVTPVTLILAGITIVAAVIQGIFKEEMLTDMMDVLHTHSLTVAQMDTLETSTWMVYLLFIAMSVLPVFWAWQNYRIYKTAWLYAVAGLLIVIGLQVFAAIGVLIICARNLWTDSPQTG